jgi:hypothetical protein
VRTAPIARDSRLRALRRRRLRHSVGSGRCGRHVNERLATGDSRQENAEGVEPGVIICWMCQGGGGDSSALTGNGDNSMMRHGQLQSANLAALSTYFYGRVRLMTMFFSVLAPLPLLAVSCASVYPSCIPYCRSLFAIYTLDTYVLPTSDVLGCYQHQHTKSIH